MTDDDSLAVCWLSNWTLSIVLDATVAAGDGPVRHGDGTSTTMT